MPQTKQEKAIMIKLKQNEKVLDSKQKGVGDAVEKVVLALKSRDLVKVKSAQDFLNKKNEVIDKLLKEKRDLEERLSLKQEGKIKIFWNNSDVAQRFAFLTFGGVDEKEASIISKLAFQNLNENAQDKVSTIFENRVLKQIEEFRNL